MNVIKSVQVGNLGKGDALAQVEPALSATYCQKVIIIGDPQSGREYESALSELTQKYSVERAVVFAIANMDTPDWVVLARLETALERAVLGEEIAK